jgi:hypothetical protein
VILELPIIQHLRFVLATPPILVLCLSCLASASLAQSQRPNLPDPVKFVNKFDVVANVVYAVFEEMDYQIELDDRKGGKITTRPYEFITGSLTSSEVDKVAIKQDTLTSNWLKARYTVEALLEIVSPTETLVTIGIHIEALNRDLDGTEKWVPLDSLGTIERRILGKISIKLLGNDAPVTKRKGFWGQKPQPVDPRTTRFPTDPSR